MKAWAILSGGEIDELSIRHSKEAVEQYIEDNSLAYLNYVIRQREYKIVQIQITVTR